MRQVLNNLLQNCIVQGLVLSVVQAAAPMCLACKLSCTVSSYQKVQTADPNDLACTLLYCIVLSIGSGCSSHGSCLYYTVLFCTVNGFKEQYAWILLVLSMCSESDSYGSCGPGDLGAAVQGPGCRDDSSPLSSWLCAACRSRPSGSAAAGRSQAQNLNMSNN